MAKLRAKLAASVSTIERPEDFSWNKWLKVPLISTESFSFAKIKFIEKSAFNNWLEIPSSEVIFFDTPEIRILELPEFNCFLQVRATKSFKFSLQIQKSARIFFSINPAKVSKEKFKDPLTAKPETVLLIAEKIEIPKLRTLNFNGQKTLTFALHEFFFKTPVKITDPVSINKKFDFKFSLQEIFDRMIFENETGISSLNNFLISSKSIDFIDESITQKFFIQSEFYSENVTKNLIGYENLTKLKSKEQLQKFFLQQFRITENLLESTEGIKVTENLLDFIPETLELQLLNISDFKTEVKSNFDLKIKNDKRGFITKEIPTNDLTNSASKILAKYSDKFKFADVNFTSHQIRKFGTPDVSQNLITVNPVLIPEIISQTGNFAINKVRTLAVKSINLNKTEIFESAVENHPSLLPSFDEDYEKILPAFNNLKEHQKAGVEFLAKNRFAVLADEISSGKKIQAISALKILMKLGAVKNILILTNHFEFGSKKLSVLRNKSIGWEGYLNFWAPELTVRSIVGDKVDREMLWKLPAQVNLIDANDFAEDLISNKIGKKKLSKINLILLDNISIKDSEIFNKAVNDLSVNYLWILKDYLVEDKLSEEMFKLRSIVKDYIKKNDEVESETEKSFILKRSRAEIANQLPKKIYHEKWIDLSQEQDAEYKIILEAGKRKVNSAVEAGNIFMIQPQIFGLLHQLMQTFNYSPGDEISPKEELLLSQVSSMKSGKEKVVIFSQYEKFGIKIVEENFTKNGIGFRTYLSNTSEAALLKNLKDFVSNEEITALIIDGKALRNVLNLGNAVSNIIHYDHWWNPISTWQLEDKIFTNGNPVNVFTYLTRNSVEENIYRVLSEKKLMNKNLMDSLSAANVADIVTSEDWLNILEVKDESEIEEVNPVVEHINKVQEKLNNLSAEEFEEVAKGLFVKLGYANNSMIKYSDEKDKGIFLTSKTVNNKEETIVVKFVHDEKLEPGAINKFTGALNDYKNISKSFLVTSGILAKESYQFPEVENNGINIIDGSALSSYLVQFNIM